MIPINSRIKQQAQILKQGFSIPLHLAQELTAKRIYNFRDWKELISVVEKNPKDLRLTLARVTKKSSITEIQLLEQKIPDIAKSINNYLNSNLTREQFIKLIRRSFGLTDITQHTFLPQNIPTFINLKWKPIGPTPDRNSVLETKVKINGITFLLIATRVFNPIVAGWSTNDNYWHDNFVDYIWYDENKWRDYVKATENFNLSQFEKKHSIEPPFFLQELIANVLGGNVRLLDNEKTDTNYYEENYPEIEIPMQVENNQIKQHREWVESILDDQDYIPVRIKESAYLIIGFRCGDDTIISNSTISNLFSDMFSTGKNYLTTGDDSALIGIMDGGTLRLEGINATQKKGEFLSINNKWQDHLNRIIKLVYSHKKANLTLCNIDGNWIIVIYPATQSDISNLIKLPPPAPEKGGTLKIWTSDINWAYAIIKLAFERNIYYEKISSHGKVHTRFFVLVSYNDVKKILLSANLCPKSGLSYDSSMIRIDCFNQSGMIYSGNIVSSISASRDKRRKTTRKHICYLDEIIFEIIEAFTPEELYTSMKYGTYLFTNEPVFPKNRYDSETNEYIYPNWVDSLPTLSHGNIRDILR